MKTAVILTGWRLLSLSKKYYFFDKGVSGQIGRAHV